MRDPAIVSRNFGTTRGLVRLGLSYGQWLVPGQRLSPSVPASIERLVFVCHGNICRSAFAEKVAWELGMNTASFGLSTSSGKGAHPPVAAYAESVGLPLDDHVTTRVEDFEPRTGDLLLAMEFRHLDKLAQNAALKDTPRDLLGLYHRPPVPHLHDPYKLDPAYLPVCMERTRRAVERLAVSFPNARRA